MATPNIVPRADQEGGLGTAAKSWGKLFINQAAGQSTAAVSIENSTVAQDTLSITTANTTYSAIRVAAADLTVGTVFSATASFEAVDTIRTAGVDLHCDLDSTLSTDFYGINLNIGCPSKKVQKGKFGVCLMKEPKLVNRLIKSMKNETNLDVSVKCRTGVDNSNKYEFLKQFVNEVSNAGCNIFFVHARKALLKGLNPAQNRTIPKLEYEKVYKLKEDFPENKVIINGGINCIEKFKEISKNLDGIMVGRLIQKNPFILLNVDEKIFGMKKTEYNKFILIKKYFEYMKNNIAKQSPYYLISPLLSLYFGQPGAKIWRKKINDLIRYKKFDNLEDICSNLV